MRSSIGQEQEQLLPSCGACLARIGFRVDEPGDIERFEASRQVVTYAKLDGHRGRSGPGLMAESYG